MQSFNRMTRIIKFSKNPKKQPTISSADTHYTMSITGCQVKSFAIPVVFSKSLRYPFQPICLSARDNNTSSRLCQAIYATLSKNISPLFARP